MNLYLIKTILEITTLIILYVVQLRQDKKITVLEDKENSIVRRSILSKKEFDRAWNAMKENEWWNKPQENRDINGKVIRDINGKVIKEYSFEDKLKKEEKRIKKGVQFRQDGQSFDKLVKVGKKKSVKK